MKRATIQSDFWHKRLEVNARRAIFHQWEQLEASGCIETFRLAAGNSTGFRAGWFFADSDAYKWLDAAARIWAQYPDVRLEQLMDSLIGLLAAAQDADGYLFTYNQIHFPGTRWQNLQIEHELYCHGHLIEAGISHFETTSRTDLLELARRAADRIVADFRGKGAAYTPGHEEIEIALIRLYQAVPDGDAYLEMARQFIEQRGRFSGFALSLLRQNVHVARRGEFVRQKKQAYLAAHPDFKPFQLPPGNVSKLPRNSKLRWYANALSGKYFQQHAPVREQSVPVGHSVRFAYLQTAVAMLRRSSGDPGLQPALEAAWERMVLRRMYVTGGIGSLPGLEGFGNDYELDSEYAYAETCAALASLFWNWEMAQLTGEARYSDLFEWQLYNAAAVGMGLDGTSYLYNNPLACRGGVRRKPWYAVPCCPSNISRTWADLGKYIFSSEPGELIVHQYISSRLDSETIQDEDGSGATVSLEMQSSLPWGGRVLIKLSDVGGANPGRFALRLRQPSWAAGMQVTVNGDPVPVRVERKQVEETPASGYDPRQASFISLNHPWAAGEMIEIAFEMPIRLLHAHPKVKRHKGRVTVTRGPLVYCLEDVDNPDIDLFTVRLDPASLSSVFDQEMLDGINRIEGKTLDGKPLTFIPYFLWGNRGPSQMTVWINC
jgi:DUF1680 family protein